ncbi:MAG: hypothetical protein KKH75_04550 [Actinobacteria bacterium]|nr:hypothetical protein [Actinomycetota bacterium]
MDSHPESAAAGATADPAESGLADPERVSAIDDVFAGLTALDVVDGELVPRGEEQPAVE